MNAVLSGLVMLLTFVAASKAMIEQEIPNSEEYGVGCKSDISENEDPSQIPPGSLDIDGNVVDSSRVVQVLRVTNGASWGTWGKLSFCPPGSYAAGYDMKQGKTGDDTAANYVKFKCRCLDEKNKHQHVLVKYPGHGFYGKWGD